MKRTPSVSRRVVLLLASALPLLAEEDSSVPTVQSEAVAAELDLGNSVEPEELPNKDDWTFSAAFHVAQESADVSAAMDSWDTIHNNFLKQHDSGPRRQSIGHDLAGAPKHRASTRRRPITTDLEPWYNDWMADYDVNNNIYFPFFAFDDDSDDSDAEYNLFATDLLNATQKNEILKNITDTVEHIDERGILPFSKDDATKADLSYQFENATAVEVNAGGEAQSVDGEADQDASVIGGDLEVAPENKGTQQNASEPMDDQVKDRNDPEPTNQTDISAVIEESQPIAEDVKSGEEEQSKLKHVAVDYASKAVGALILDSSPNFQGASNLLQKDNDKYAIVPCDEENKYVVIGLSEDILVKQIVLSNFERYSSHMKEIHLSGSTTTALGSKDWVDLGTYVTTPVTGGIRKQTFDLKEPTWARYLRFEFLSHYGDEYYCTVSQISVHGSTMVQGFHEQWAELESVQNSDEDVPLVTETEKSISSDETVLDNSSNDAALLADVDSLRTLDDEATDAGYLPRADTGAARRFPQTFKSCVLRTGFSCPSSQDFEERMLHFLSGDSSGSDALSSASICLSSSLPATSNQSFLEMDRLRLRNWSGELKSDLRRGRAAELPRVPSGGIDKGYISYTLEKPSPVVEIIKDIIRQTANAINIEGIGSSLLRSLPVRSESHSASKIEPPSKLAEVTNQEENVKQDPSQPTASKSESTIEKEVEFDIYDTNHSLARLLQRLPSSKCLDKLNFAGFKKEFLAQRSKGSSQHEKNHPSGVPMEPIFKKLTDEIKALQANVAVHDQFAKESILCFQSVLLEVLTEMELLRASHDARISKLENDFYIGPWLATIWRLSTAFLVWVLQPMGGVLLTLIEERTKVQDAVASTAVAVVLLVLYLWNRRRMNHSRWLSRRIQQQQQESDLEIRHPPPPTPKRDDQKTVPVSNGSPSSVATLSSEHSMASSSHYSAGQKKLGSDGGHRKRRPLTGRLFVK